MNGATLHAAIIKVIRRHMDENRITRMDLAHAMNCQATYVTNILTERTTERGGRTTLRSLQRVLDVLGLDVEVVVIDRRPDGAL